MAYRESELSLTVRLYPDEARERITKAYSEAQANLVTTAVKLGCSDRTLRRWIDTLDLEPALNRLKARAIQEGWHHTNSTHGGRPRAS